MFNVLTVLLSMLAVGQTVLLANFFADFSWGSLFLVPVSLLGLSMGALLMAVQPEWRAKFEARICEWAALGAALAWLGLPYQRLAQLTPGLTATVLCLSIAAQTVFGAVLTRTLQKMAVTRWFAGVILGATSSLLVLCTLKVFGAPLIALAFYGLTTILIVTLGVRRPRTLGLTLAVLIAGIIWNRVREPSDTVFTANGAIHFERFTKPSAGIKIDINQQKTFFAWDPETTRDTDFLKSDEMFALLSLAVRGRVAIINSIGGSEILQARLAGFKNIDVVEPNLRVVEELKSRLRRPELTFAAPEVNLRVSEARHFFRRLKADQKYDAIVVVGGLGRSLFTREGVSEVASHLNPQGLLILRMAGEPADFLTGLEYSMLAGLGSESENEGEQLLKIHRDNTNRSTTFAYRKRGFTTVKKGIDRLRDRLKVPLNFIPLEPAASVMEWPRAFIDDRPYTRGLATTKSILACVAVFAGLILLGLMRLSSGPLMAGSYLSGMGFIGFEIMALEWLSFAAGDGIQTPVILQSVMAVSGVAGLWRALRRNSDDRKTVLSSLYLRAVLSGILAFYLIRHLDDLVTDATLVSAIGGLLCVAPAYFAAQAIAIQLLLIKPGGERAMGYYLATFALGLGFGGVIVKLVALALGQSAAAAAVVGFFFLASVVFSEERPSPFASIPLSLPS